MLAESAHLHSSLWLFCAQHGHRRVRCWRLSHQYANKVNPCATMHTQHFQNKLIRYLTEQHYVNLSMHSLMTSLNISTVNAHTWTRCRKYPSFQLSSQHHTKTKRCFPLQLWCRIHNSAESSQIPWELVTHKALLTERLSSRQTRERSK